MDSFIVWPHTNSNMEFHASTRVEKKTKIQLKRDRLSLVGHRRARQTPEPSSCHIPAALQVAKLRSLRVLRPAYPLRHIPVLSYGLRHVDNQEHPHTNV